MTTDVEITLDGGIQTIRFNRPDKKNAITSQMYHAMSAALDEGEVRDEILVHLFVGSGGSFTAGNDIADFAKVAMSGASAVGGEAEAEPIPPLQFVRRLPRVTKPMIAAVDGLAVGVGTTLLMHCDLVFASQTASLRTPFLQLGLVPEAGSSLLAQRMGYQRAFEMLCLGEAFGADRAMQAGLINAVVAPQDLEAIALAAAVRLTALPQGALRAARALMRGGEHDAICAKIDEEAEVFTKCLVSAEAREAFSAFMEKRAPDFAKLKGDS